MSREEIYDGVNSVFRDLFDDEDILVTDSTTAADIEDWDSLEHINLIVGIEDKFNVKFSMGETISMKNVGDMVDILMARINS